MPGGSRSREPIPDRRWQQRAWSILDGLSNRGIPFTSDDFWVAGLPKSAEPRALGAVLKQAAVRGLIVPTGRVVKSRSRSRHHTMVREWIARPKRSAP